MEETIVEHSGTTWSEVSGVTWAPCELGGLSWVARLRWKELGITV